MRTLTLTLTLTLAALAGCTSAAAHHPATPAKAAARVPLKLSLEGVKFDQVSRSAAAAALEMKGWRRVGSRWNNACDIFRPPLPSLSTARAAVGPSRLAVCWIRLAGQDRWASAWLTWPAPPGPFGALVRGFSQRLGRGPVVEQDQPLLANSLSIWKVAGGRGRVVLSQSFPNMHTRLHIIDYHAMNVLLTRLQRGTLRKQTTHAVIHPPAVLARGAERGAKCILLRCTPLPHNEER